MQEYFKIGELSRLYGIGVDSLRYYEKIGILHPERTESGYRHYSVQDIWKLNIIRDLRALGFPMDRIRDYLQNHSVDSTLDLLQQEEQAIDEKIQYLKKLRENVSQRMETIQGAREQPKDVLTLKHYPDRHCYSIPEGYSDEHEMDVLIKRLLNMDRDHLYVIGSNQIGTAISLETARDIGKICYQSVFLVDDQGEKLLPGGDYLSVTYQGDYKKSRYWVAEILTYAASHGYTLKGELLEILWIDIHTSGDIREHVTELQVLVET